MRNIHPPYFHIGSLSQGKFCTGFKNLSVNSRTPFRTACDAAKERREGSQEASGYHCREDLLGNELMAPFAENATTPLKAITVGALWDKDYMVNMSAADTFRL